MFYSYSLNDPLDQAIDSNENRSIGPRSAVNNTGDIVSKLDAYISTNETLIADHLRGATDLR